MTWGPANPISGQNRTGENGTKQDIRGRDGRILDAVVRRLLYFQSHFQFGPHSFMQIVQHHLCEHFKDADGRCHGKATRYNVGNGHGIQSACDSPGDGLEHAPVMLFHHRRTIQGSYLFIRIAAFFSFYHVGRPTAQARLKSYNSDRKAFEWAPGDSSTFPSQYCLPVSES